MPGWDGIETIRRIRADRRFDAPPAILMVSGCTREEVAQKDAQVMPEAFLSKPVGPTLLYHSLLQVLRPDLAEGSDAAGTFAWRDLDRLAGARILLVEDNANNREVALDFLSAAPVQVDVAVHGAEAVQMVRDGDYDLVLMDIQMPGMDGFTAARQIRALGTQGAVPVVAMTAYAMAGDREQSLAAGMNDHVTKPIDPERLFRALRKWIDPARLAGRVTVSAPAPVVAAPAPVVAAPVSAVVQLPVIAGLNWERALARADHRMDRLYKRVASFMAEYGRAPEIAREALVSGEYHALERLVHNLKASGAYIGAGLLSGMAEDIEDALRSGQLEEAAAELPEFVALLDRLMEGLARVGPGEVPAPPPAAGPAPELELLVRNLDALLRAGDSLAHPTLDALEAVIGGIADLGPIRRALEDVDYRGARDATGAVFNALGMAADRPV